MISLIVATRNRPDFLYRCLLAIGRQTCRKFECIVVGDHCEYAKKVVDKFAFASFIDYRGPDIQNVGAIGKNIGIEAAKGDRICYCDDDNILLPDHIEVMDKAKGDLVFTTFMQSSYGQATAHFMLDRPLYSTYNHRKGLIDALAMCHTKEAWEQVGGWKPLAEVGYNEDGYFIGELDKIISSVKVPALTAIYNAHAKTFDEYNELLPTANPVVYPELIKEWI